MIKGKKDKANSNLSQKKKDPSFKTEKGRENSWVKFFFSLSEIWHSKNLRNKYLFLFLFAFFATIFGFFAGGFIYAKVVLGIVICIIFYIVFLILTIFNVFEILSKNYGDLDIFAFRFLVLFVVIFAPAILSSVVLSILYLVNPTSYFLVGNVVSLLLICVFYLFVFAGTFLNDQIKKVVYKIIKKESEDAND